MAQNNWYTQDANVILEAMASSEKGLTKTEAAHRLQTDGENELETSNPPNIILLFLRQFHNILIYALILSAIVTAFLGHMVDTGVILGVIILNAIFGIIQERKAEG